VFELSGCTVQFEEPPDLLITTDTFKIGCAAKRLRTTRKTEANCRDAVDQIRRSGLPGIVALDISFALGAEGCINTNDRSGGRIFVKTRVLQYLEEYGGVLAKICDADDIIGVFIYLHMPMLVVPTLEVTSVFRLEILTFLRPSDPRLSWIKKLEHLVGMGHFAPLAQKATQER
jgi:hypothetical protein